VHTQQQQLSSLPCFTWSIQRIACVNHCSSLSLDNMSQRSRCAGVILLYRVLHETLPPHVSLFDSSLTARS